ncbi:MAG TPA: response regulator transcription factor [Egibacteraceae bacterium]|nr:response regulator transcription factor [Egibacteraceae bacterium]
MPIRVVLAEDSYLVREGVRMLIETEPELELTASCGDLDALLAAVEETQPDVVLSDIRMPPTGTDEGIRAAAQLRQTHPQTGFVVLSQYVEPEYALALFRDGSERRAYLLKERVADLDQLLAAIRAVASGGSVVDPKVVDALVEGRSRQQQSTLDRLTPREQEVLAEIAQGKNNAAIASTLFLTERAVEKHINAIFSKLGLTDQRDTHRRVQAVLLYLAERGA